MTEDLLYAASAGFESARRVGALPGGHRSSRLHGHSFLAEIRARQDSRAPAARPPVPELVEGG